MSEVTTETTVAPQTLPAQTRQDAIDSAAAASLETTEEAGAPLTKEDVAGTKPAGESSDRVLVAPSIREFLREQQAEPEPVQTALEKEISDLRSALDGLAGKGAEAGEISVADRTLAKLEALEERELARNTADAEATAEEEYNNRVRVMREGVIENITARKEDFPGLVALEQQETCFNALVPRSHEGEETSEDDIASEMEQGLRTVYETLHKVYANTPSEDQTPASDAKVTLNPGLSSTSEAADVDKMSRSERIEYLWAKSQQS
jgi:hypothetical protein